MSKESLMTKFEKKLARFDAPAKEEAFAGAKPVDEADNVKLEYKRAKSDLQHFVEGLVEKVHAKQKSGPTY